MSGSIRKTAVTVVAHSHRSPSAAPRSPARPSNDQRRGEQDARREPAA